MSYRPCVARRTLCAKIAMQLGHAGRKASTRLSWEGDVQPLDTGNWPIVAPSAKYPQAQPACYNDPATHAIDCGAWGVSATWVVPSTATSRHDR